MPQTLRIPKDILTKIPQPEFWSMISGTVCLPLSATTETEIVNSSGVIPEEAKEFFGEMFITSYLKRKNRGGRRKVK